MAFKIIAQNYVDKVVSGGTYNPSTSEITFTNTNNDSFVVTGITSGSSDIITTATTTGATVTTIDTYGYTTQDTTYFFKAYITAIQDDGSNGYYGELTSIIRNDGGVLNQIGSIDLIEKSDFATATATIDFTGTDVRVRITGEAATNMNWRCRLTIN